MDAGVNGEERWGQSENETAGGKNGDNDEDAEDARGCFMGKESTAERER